MRDPEGDTGGDPRGSGPGPHKHRVTGIPWEEREEGFFARFFSTLALPFRPLIYSKGMRGGPVPPALNFALLTLLPLAALRGVMPYTEHFTFAPGLSLRIDPNVSAGALATDIARAASLSLVLTVVLWLALTLPFVHISRAFGEPGSGRASWRTMMYGAWLLPLALDGLARQLLFWFWPSLPAGPGAWMAFFLASFAPLLVLVVMWMRSVARYANRLGYFQTVSVLFVSMAMLLLTHAWLDFITRPLMPTPAPEGPQPLQAPEDGFLATAE